MSQSNSLAVVSNRLDWLDALRGWAVLGVLLVHSGQAAHSAGWVAKVTAAGLYGVQLFFVVSALTISLTYESHIAQHGSSLRSQFSWFLKRFFRIAPLYYMAAIFYPLEHFAIYGASHHHYGSVTALPDILANLLFIHTWIPSANNSVVPGGWSIGVEMFFYSLVPLVWMIKSVRARALSVAMASIAGICCTLAASQFANGRSYVAGDTYFFYWFPTQAPVLFIGLIFYFLNGSTLRLSERRRSHFVYLIGFLVSFSAGYYLGVGGEVAPVLAPAIFAVSFIFLIFLLHGPLKPVVVNRYSVGIGKISFSLYILHFAVLDSIRAAFQIFHIDRMGAFELFPVFIATLAITSIFALITKRFVEDPGVAFGHRLSKSIASGTSGGRQAPAPESN